MADNYLERKIEEHRTGGAHRRGPALPSKGKVSFNLPPKRVIIFDNDNELSRAVIKAFAEAGCRVALYTKDKGTTNRDTGGARLIQSTGNPSNDLSNVLQSWGDIDIIISTQSADSVLEIIETILHHRLTLPYPNDYGLRMITIGTSTPTDIPDDVTCNTIVLTPTVNNAILRQAALTALFLSIPELSAINHSTLKIN